MRLPRSFNHDQKRWRANTSDQRPSFLMAASSTLYQSENVFLICWFHGAKASLFESLPDFNLTWRSQKGPRFMAAIVRLGKEFGSKPGLRVRTTSDLNPRHRLFRGSNRRLRRFALSHRAWRKAASY